MKPIRIKEVKVQNDEKSGRYLPEDKKVWSACEVMVLDDGVTLPVLGSDSLIKAHQLM